LERLDNRRRKIAVEKSPSGSLTSEGRNRYTDDFVLGGRTLPLRPDGFIAFVFYV
jgi:hypothetical protein